MIALIKAIMNFERIRAKMRAKVKALIFLMMKRRKKKKKPNALTVFKSSLKHAIVKTKKGFLGWRGETLKG